MAKCRCNKVELDDYDAFIVNGIMHESFAVEKGFCGPVAAHDLRSALAKVEEQRVEIERLKRADEIHDEVYEASCGEVTRLTALLNDHNLTSRLAIAEGLLGSAQTSIASRTFCSATCRCIECLPDLTLIAEIDAFLKPNPDEKKGTHTVPAPGGDTGSVCDDESERGISDVPSPGALSTDEQSGGQRAEAPASHRLKLGRPNDREVVESGAGGAGGAAIGDSHDGCRVNERRYREKLDAANAEIAEWKTTATDERTEVMRLTKQIDELRADMETIVCDTGEARRVQRVEIAELRTERSALQMANKRLQNEIDRLKSLDRMHEAEACAGKLKELHDDASQNAQEVTDLKAKLAEERKTRQHLVEKETAHAEDRAETAEARLGVVREACQDLCPECAERLTARAALETTKETT